MERERYIETGSGSLYGEYLNEQLVSEDHILRKLKDVVDWGYFNKQLIKLCKGQGVVGRPPCDQPLII